MDVNVDLSPRAQRELFRRFGFSLAWGAVQLIACVALYLIAFAWLQTSVLNRWRSLDETDRDWRHRSGLSLYTDHGTGCQYLKVGSALTPRLSAAGSQLCGAR